MKRIYDERYRDLNLPNNNNPNLFKPQISEVYMVGHSITSAICRSFDLKNWEEIESFSNCVLAKNEEILDYRFKPLFLEAVEDFNIPLKLEIVPKEKLENFDKILNFEELVKEKDLDLIISFNDKKTDLREELYNLLSNPLRYNNRSFVIA